MNLIDFFKRLLESYNLYITEDNFVKTGAKQQTVMCAARPLVLPTKEHIESCLITNDEGKIEVGKTLFNPVTENSLKAENSSLAKLKAINEITIANLLYIAGQLLLILANNKELQKKTNLLVNEFLVSASELKNPQVKELVDTKMIETWSKLYAKLSDNREFVKIFLKKAGTKDGIKFNRLAVMNIPLYDELCKEKTEQFDGIKLRPREVKMFKLLIEFLIPEIKNKETVTYGSNDDLSPGFISLMILSLRQSKKLLEVAESLKDLDQELYEENIIKFKVSEEDIFTVNSKYKSDLLIIPYEGDLIVTNTKVNVPQVNNAPIIPTAANTNVNDGFITLPNGMRVPVVKDQPATNIYSQSGTNVMTAPQIINTNPVTIPNMTNQSNLNSYVANQVETKSSGNIIGDFLVKSGLKSENTGGYWGNALTQRKPANPWFSNNNINNSVHQSYVPSVQIPQIGMSPGQLMQTRFN